MDTTAILGSAMIATRPTGIPAEIDRFYEDHTGLQLRRRIAALWAKIAASLPRPRTPDLAIRTRSA